jgi:hypothetical protein
MTMKMPFLLAAAVVAVLSLQPGVAQAQRGQVVVGTSFNGGHGGHWRGGRHRGGVRLGIGIGFGVPYYYGAPNYGYGPWYPGPVLVAPPPLAYAEPAPVPMAPEPVIYPNNGQTPTQTEADRQACDRWAMSQPNAMANASVFHRATLACMEGRGYTVR